MNQSISTLLLLLVLSVIIFFIISYLVMYTYNGSIVRMNDSWKPLNFERAIMFTLFLMLIGKFFTGVTIKN
jgi:Kef-type K+ transport system membrane component KefB